MNCKLVLSNRSRFFHSRRFFSSHAKLRSTIQRLGFGSSGRSTENLSLENHGKTWTMASQPVLTSRITAFRYLTLPATCSVLSPRRTWFTELPTSDSNLANTFGRRIPGLLSWTPRSKTRQGRGPYGRRGDDHGCAQC